MVEENGNKFLRFKGTSPTGKYPGIWLGGPTETWKDYIFEARVRAYQKLLVFCFYDSSSGFYQAGLNFPDSVYFADYVPGRAESFQTVTSASHRLETNKWYSVKVTMIGDIFTMKIDDKVVMTASRNNSPRAGLVSSPKAVSNSTWMT